MRRWRTVPATRRNIESPALHRIEQPIIGADVVEYNPRCDIAKLTATVAPKLVKEIAGMMLKTAL